MAEEKEESKADLSWLPAGCEPLADGDYDAIVLGTGLTECIMSGLLSTKGLKVLHLDRNNYYGGDSASLNLTNLFAKYGKGSYNGSLGSDRDYNVDLIPKFIMACGALVKILLHTKVTRYLEFKNIDASYTYRSKWGLYKVPATAAEALSTSLMGMFEKRRFGKMLKYIEAYDPSIPSTTEGIDITKAPMSAIYQKFGVDANTQSFTGHSMALQTTDDYLHQPAKATIDALKLYVYSVERYGKSPYIYPLYGLGGLPEGFSRLCAINGGTFMLDRAVEKVLFDDDGNAWGIKVKGESKDAPDQVARATMVIGDPSYFDPSKVRQTKKVVRVICILNHPIPNTKDAESVQIILPADQIGRKNDIYLCSVSFAHCVAAKGMWVAIASTVLEGNKDPVAQVSVALDLLGNIADSFVSVSDVYEPVSNGHSDRCFISKSYDETSHFESVASDVMDLYERITGEQIDLSKDADLNADEEY